MRAPGLAATALAALVAACAGAPSPAPERPSGTPAARPGATTNLVTSDGRPVTAGLCQGPGRWYGPGAYGPGGFPFRGALGFDPKCGW